MTTISPEALGEELRLREKSQNYAGILKEVAKNQNETNAARGAAGGNAVGEVVGGVESLIAVANNLVENAESTRETVIAIVKEKGHGLEADLKPLLTDAEIVSVNKVLKNSAVTIAEVFGPTIASFTAASKMNHKIIIDASPEAATKALKKAAGLLSNDKLLGLQQALAPEKFKDIIEDAVKKIDTKEIQANVAKVLATVEGELKKTTDGVSSGNLLKDITEDVSRNLSTTIGNFGDEFTRLKSLPIINDLLGGNNALGLDKAISTLKIDPSLLKKPDHLVLKLTLEV